MHYRQERQRLHWMVNVVFMTTVIYVGSADVHHDDAGDGDDDDNKLLFLFCMWASALCICFYINPAPLNGSTQFHYCTDSNPGTAADDAFVLKRGVWRNATWPLHSRPAIAASARHFQICFLP